jgi:hypothetical protein
MTYSRLAFTGATALAVFVSLCASPLRLPPIAVARADTVVSAWNGAALPLVDAWADPNPIELGVKFRVDNDGVIVGIRFYKGAPNTGTHTGTLWTATGDVVASATFMNETASGWQEVDFDPPVPVSADTVYVASYHTDVGYYAGDPAYFAIFGVDNGPLHLLASGASGGNGVYAYSAVSTFPTSSFNAANYWVDVVFATDAPPPPATATRTVTPIPPTPTPTSTATPFPTIDYCSSAAANAIVAENCQPGSPRSEWDVQGAGDPTIQGFATDISVNRGDSIGFKIDTDAAAYRLDIYRLGYYGGLGARLVATVLPSVPLPQNQPDCLNDPDTGLVDCGNWAVSATWQVPATATSGIYVAKLVRTDTQGASHIPFVVRDDAGGSALLFQTSDPGWQAYNAFGGNSFYSGAPAGRAYKVSYNRPFTTRCCNFPDGAVQGYLFDSEYPMLRWLERNGYDVSYASGVDTDRRGAAGLLSHQVFLSVGHDEYWSGGQRAAVETARNAGVHLAFFSGNEGFWKTRWEPSIDGSNTPYRTLVCYKETHANAKIDPLPGVWTGTWRDPRFGPHDGGRPENAVSGTIFTVNGPTNNALNVPAADGRMRFWRNTSIATQSPSGVATLPYGVLGFEWDEDLDNGARPPGLIRLSTTTAYGVPYLQDYGSTYDSGTATHHLTLYKHPSGALVFGGGTVQWAWGLDDQHDDMQEAPTDLRMQQATANLFADMGVQAGSLQEGLVPAGASTDTIAPTSTITTPDIDAMLTAGNAVTISGTAADNGGGVVGGVEVSVDGGATWHPADGRESWTYLWTVGGTGTTVILSRATDDSGNTETPAAGVSVTIASAPPAPTPVAGAVTIWPPEAVPGTASQNDSSAVELGVKFTSDVDGLLTGIRYYKSAANTGLHTATLWDSTGVPLATATFLGESASGWQQANFLLPVAITANAVYVASYHTTTGHYAGDLDYFANAGVDNPPLHALRDGVSGSNGVYAYGLLSTFPTNSFRAANYWVDVVFVGPATPTPTMTSTAIPTDTPSPTATASATFTAIDTATPTATATATRTATGTSTGTPTATATRTPTVTATFTVTATPTRTPTVTQTPTNTPTSTPTPTATPVLPPAPTGVTATGSASGASLAWTASNIANFAGYNVYRSSSASGPFARLNAALLSSPSYDDTSAPDAVDYYRVTVVNTDNLESNPSATASATMPVANRLANAGFELDANNDTRPDSWTTNTNVTRSNAVVRSEVYAMRHVATTNASYTISQTVSGLRANTSYTFGGWVNVPAPANAFTFTLQIRWRAVFGIALRTDTVKTYTAATSGWNKAAATLTSPALTNDAVIDMVVGSLNANIYVDDLGFR